MNRNTALIVALALTVGSGAATVGADGMQGRGRGQAAKPDKSAQGAKAAKPAADKPTRKDDADFDKAFDRDRHVRVIRDYRAGGSLPPGLAKRESLPPGLRRQIRERGELPPGLEKHLVDVPEPLGARLPPLPRFYHRYFAGDDLVVVDTRTNTIVRVIPDVLR